MVPNLIGAMCAITWHIYDNQDALYGLVTLQGIFTFIGNSTLALASFTIFKKKETYEWIIYKIFMNPTKIIKSLRVKKDSAKPWKKSTSTRVLSW